MTTRTRTGTGTRTTTARTAKPERQEPKNQTKENFQIKFTSMKALLYTG